MSSSQVTGTNANEEWRAMDGARADYDPSASADVLKAARAHIADKRRRPAVLRLVDRSGAPLAGRRVGVHQLSHDFPFGEQLWTLDAMYRDGEQDTARARALKARFLELFNASNNLCYWTERPRNDASKSEEFQGETRIENFAATVDWSRANGLIAKGHPLFWSIPKAIPDWLARYDRDTFMKFAEVRVRNLVARFRGRVTLWDVVNEPMWEAAPQNLARRSWPHIEPIAAIADYVEPVLRWCRAEDPDACLLVNDYGMEKDDDPAGRTGSDGSRVTAASQRRRYVELFRELDRRECPPDAIGLQSHSGWFATHSEQWAVYDAFAETGLPIHITEFWADRTTLEASGRYSRAAIDELQAEYICNYLTCAFGHPRVEAFFFWGLLGAAIDWFDRSGHELRPVFNRVRQLLREEWMTAETCVTDANGVIALPVFPGKYALRLMDAAGGVVEGKTTHIAAGAAGAGGAPIEVRFSALAGGAGGAAAGATA